MHVRVEWAYQYVTSYVVIRYPSVEILILVGAIVAGLLLAKSENPFRPNRRRRQRRPQPKLRPASPRDIRRRTVAGPTPTHSAINSVAIEGSAYVTDGDSLVINRTEVRLYGVDAPELKHPFGQKAKWALVGLCKGQTVHAKIVHTDKHGRTVAKCYLPDGRDLSAEMVKLGLALDWPKFSGGKYTDLEMPGARKKLWLADARQKGHMHVWEKFEKRDPGSNA